MTRLELDASIVKQVIIVLRVRIMSFLSVASSSSCSNSGSLRLTGGTTDNEGVLEYCYNGKWSPFCYLDDEEAAVACKQLGYSQYAGWVYQALKLTFFFRLSDNNNFILKN